MRIQISASLFLFSLFVAVPVHAADYTIKMLNASTADSQHTNVFEPSILFVEPGDTVTFLPTDAGHNAASKRGMIPDGAEPWNSAMDEAFTVTLDVPGVYGY
ncbi:MAG: plastocyanin/azurin family copper-binding protein, partial [Pseudomonadota bacterium]